MFKKILVTSFLFCVFFGTNVLAQEIKNEGGMLLLDPEIERQMSLDISFLFCEDSTCGKEKEDFYINESFFIDYKSDNKFPVTVHIKEKGNDFKDTVFVPSYYQFKNKGIYEFSFNIDIKDFKDFNYKKTIKVKAIEKNELCNVDGECSGQETKQNCPQDCLDSKAQPQMSTVISTRIIVLLFLALVIIIAMIASYFYFIKPKNNSIE